MPITRKRKAASPDHSKQSVSTTQPTINSYGRVTKSQSIDQSAKKRKTIDTATITTTAPTPKSTKSRATTKKQEPTPAVKSESKKRARDAEEEKTTPENKRFKDALPPTPAETPSKKASALFERLNLQKSPAKPVFSSQDDSPAKPVFNPQDDSQAYDTPPLTPRSSKSLGPSQPTISLPPQLQDLTRLFTALITSTSLFVAHHGLGEPLYLQTLLPNIAKHWKKRAVTTLDVQKVLGILDPTSLPFELADNGEGSLCLELVQNDKNAPGHFNQPDLTCRFQLQLQSLWKEWTNTQNTENNNVDAFLTQLPSCNIITSSVAASQNATSSRGHTLLATLKSTAKSARAAESLIKNPLPIAATSKSATAMANRGASLLDRILAKQALAATSASAPTQSQIERNAALDRIPDIVKVLEVLVNGKSRVSFGVKSLVGQVRDSLRNPISADEGERCLELMAGEVCPGFVKLLMVGAVRGVVVCKLGKPSDEGLGWALREAREKT